jgi:hypothetical protein
MQRGSVSIEERHRFAQKIPVLRIKFGNATLSNDRGIPELRTLAPGQFGHGLIRRASELESLTDLRETIVISERRRFEDN